MAALILDGCASRPPEGLHFTFLSPAETGVRFENTITENDSVNMFSNEYAYMGGGVGIGDFNRDGLPDIFFAGSQVSSRLYINKGGMRFEDVTESAGVGTKVWCTGVSVVDINADGWPDIYVCVAGNAPGARRRNLLFVNLGGKKFREAAVEYGLDDTAYSTQAVFFDYDRDGRLDMFLVDHQLSGERGERPNDIRPRVAGVHSPAADRLYHNEGVPQGLDHPVFRDVTEAAGIADNGYGLGVVVSDLNKDGYPDIYVANDYLANDLLWMNNGDGTFSNCIASAVRHQSYSSMGTDAADYNNDGWPDIVTLDMQPETSERKKTMYSFLNDQRHQLERDNGYEPEYVHNMLQLNNGVRKVGGRSLPFFSEVGQLAGIAETDWSWSVLMADFDNDGRKDMHITNGMGRDPVNADFLEYRYALAQHTQVGGGVVPAGGGPGPLPMRNYLFRNKGDMTMEDVSVAAGIERPTVSNGAAYVDLDNDGDLDIVTNNINQPASVMRNDGGGAGYLRVCLQGDSLNQDGVGATVYVYTRNGEQMLEQYPVRGYLSSVDVRLHFGLGHCVVDSMKVVWPDRSVQIVDGPLADSMVMVKKAGKVVSQDGLDGGGMFTEVTDVLGLNYAHKEKFFLDYAFQPLIPQQYSQEGPFISVGDMNGDGLQDLFIGGGFDQPGRIFLQQPGGRFAGKDLVHGEKHEEDMQSALVDVDNDGDLDLLVVSGSTEFDLNSPYYRPRLYINDGKGNFRQDLTAFPVDIRTPGKALAVGDWDGDGDMDVFIGGRVSLGTYPLPPRSYLLRNDHGIFTDVTRVVCPALEKPGLVNAAVFTDIDGDGRPDLVLAGDWMPVRVFRNTGVGMKEVTDEYGMGASQGFWRSLLVTDIDHDGRIDIVAGNAGLNNPFHISARQPAQLLAKDLDGNGIIEPIFCYYMKHDNGQYQLTAGISRDEWAVQMPSIKRRFSDNASYARAGMGDLLPEDGGDRGLVLHCREARSGYFRNTGKGFGFVAFALEAQVAPVNVMAGGPGGVILAGNEYHMRASVGAEDASYGLLLQGLAPVAPARSGLILDGDIRDMKWISVGGDSVLLVAVNDAPMKAFKLVKQ